MPTQSLEHSPIGSGEGEGEGKGEGEGNGMGATHAPWPTLEKQLPTA
jgi:hypothetical protein